MSFGIKRYIKQSDVKISFETKIAKGVTHLLLYKLITIIRFI